MNNIEILSPAGGFDSVIAAVRSGADAVYVGAKEFSARASAHNFDEEELRTAVRYCHIRGVKVYLALNTIIFDDEMRSALELAKRAALADIDAIIIQDMGLVSLIKEAIPGLPLHASTQMTVHTPYGAKALYELGFKRVVVSRELSLDEIREIREFCPEVELEVFVHGALCMCVSGQCWFSAMLGGRSANRGMCAQPCRLPMRFGGSDHALSLKDNGSLDWLCRLRDIGVASAKIEGRMKRPEYVAAATAAAVEARNNGKVSADSEERLRSVFSRTGFTDGYLSGKLGKDMFGYRRRDDVVTADAKLLKDIRATYKDELSVVPIIVKLTVRTGEKMELCVSDSEREVTVYSETVAEQAITKPLDSETAMRSLSKTGGTPYHITDADCDIEEGAAASAAALNALRREALKKLDDLRAIRHNYEINEIDIDDCCADGAKNIENRCCVKSTEYPKELGELGRVYVECEAIGEELPDGVGVTAPRVCFGRGREKKLYEKLRDLRQRGAEHLIAHNIASVYMGLELGYTVHGGFGLNIANSWALKWARDYGMADVELSPETDLKRIEALRKAIPVGMIRYGRMPLMITRNMPAGADESCKNNAFLQDRMNERFPVVRREGYSEIYNCVPILMPQGDYNPGEGVFNVFHFTVENSVEKMKNILEKIRENRSFERITHGLYIRGVK